MFGSLKLSKIHPFRIILRFFGLKGLYEEKELLKLQQILFFKELDFSLAEIKSFLPSKVTTWNHDALIQTLESKIQEIELLEQKLKVSKQNLHTMIEAINNKPDEITCEQNAERLMNLYFDNAKTP